MAARDPIPVIDLFAGPGGLGEGFSAPPEEGAVPRFKIRLSIEKDETAHQTLELRALYRQFGGEPPGDYYRHLRGEISREELFETYPGDAFNAKHEAWLAELGAIPHETLRSRIETALQGDDAWVLIGGPPCQAYSLVGRSRNKGIEGYSLEKDPKSRLYLEYLQLIADFWPSVFVMENVKGLLSSEIDGELIFEHIRRDLSDPAEALKLHGRQRRKGKARRYKLRALSREGLFANPSDFVVRCERHGIPQARHRVIIVGVREDRARRIRGWGCHRGQA